ncbi:MAG: hypothetical protein WC969_14745 [Elusimicrobiota bacterium]|jgi:hypothetical protein
MSPIVLSSRRPTHRRASPIGGRGALHSRALLAVLCVVALAACPSGYVQTESGATVAASTVYAQDLVGDALKVVQDVHNGAVTAHDAKAGQEPADVHAARRSKLLASAAGLRSGWDGLSAWKSGTEGGGMVAVVSKLRDALPGLLTVAVELKLVSQDYADAIGVFFGTAAQGRTPAALKKAGGV